MLLHLCFITSLLLLPQSDTTVSSDYHSIASKRASAYQFFKPTTLSSTQPPVIADFSCHPAAITLLLELELAEDIILNLELNEDLLNSQFEFLHQDGDTDRLIPHTDTLTHCYYHGYVDNHREDSRIALSTCDGIRGSIFVSGEYLYLEPVLDSHIIYRHEDGLPKLVKTCGSVSVLHEGNPTNFFTRVDRQLMYIFVELYLVMDFTLYENLGSNFTASRDYLIHVANEMDAMYDSLAVRVALVGAAVWSSSDLIEVNVNLSVTLDNFLDYIPTLKSEASVEFDNTQLLTGRDNPSSSVVGFAPISTMCQENSGGVNRDLELRTLDIAATISHEMGHNFGMEHDDVGSKSCYSCPGISCTRIMNEIGTDDVPTQFSQCSLDELTSALSSRMLPCIYNEPPHLITEPVCGNRFVEDEEECDCGSEAECPLVDPCCQPGVCLLKVGAECRAGECCDSECQFSQSDTLCREKRNGCDVAEYCSGSDSSCPADSFQTDGTVCTAGGFSSYCLTGSCNTHSEQCYTLWGSEGVSAAPDICYTQVNNEGSKFGNCGVQYNTDGSSSYIACTMDNVKCGKIQCTTPGEAILQVSASAEVTTVTLGEVVVCVGVSIDLGDDVPDLGLVARGAKCDTGKVCVNQECVDIYTVSDQVFCPVGDAGVECSGRGNCTNLSMCKCHSGYSGRSCQLSSAVSNHLFATPLMFILLFSYLFIYFVIV